MDDGETRGGGERETGCHVLNGERHVVVLGDWSKPLPF